MFFAELRRRLGPASLWAVLFAGNLGCGGIPGGKLPPQRTPGPLVEVGELKGAPYRIDVPVGWNGGLVIHSHGYRGSRVEFDRRAGDPVAETFAPLGYAVAQSGYSAGGYAVREATEDVEELRRHFSNAHGMPRETWLTGVSLGGTVTMMLLELHPRAYDGGLALCAPLGPSVAYIRETAFDLLVLAEYLFPKLLPSPARVPRDFVPTLEREAEIERALDGAPAGAEVLRRYTTARTNREVAQNLDLFAYILGELQRRWGGNAFDNRDTIYAGLGDDVAINDGVRRYAADPSAQALAVRDYTPTGLLERPLLSVRAVYDPLIGSFRADRYSDIVRVAGRSALFAQVYSRGAGHCEIGPDEVRVAFAALRRWRQAGERPAGGALTRPSPSATPTQP